MDCVIKYLCDCFFFSKLCCVMLTLEMAPTTQNKAHPEEFKESQQNESKTLVAAAI